MARKVISQEEQEVVHQHGFFTPDIELTVLLHLVVGWHHGGRRTYGCWGPR
jgi:hypothetical protein